MNKNTADQDKQRWFDVLAGKTEPNDSTTRRAAKLRKILLSQRELDRQRAPDPQAEKRLLNRVQAERAKQAATRPASFPSRIWQWIFPPSGAHLGRSGGVVAAMLVLVFGPIVLLQERNSNIVAPPITSKGIKKTQGENASQIDGLNGAATTPHNENSSLPGNRSISGANGIDVSGESKSKVVEGEYSSTTPEADSARLLKILTDAGVAASRQQEGETWLIKAQIDLAKLDEINAKLTTQFGIATPASGTLLVRFKKLQ
jgi:hypothetical protein